MGDTGNDTGVGKFCAKGGNQCVGNSGAPLCLADYTQSEFGNFCTTQCQADSECGTAAICTASKICVPSKCVGDGGMGGVP
jgi:hypothetical protein